MITYDKNATNKNSKINNATKKIAKKPLIDDRTEIMHENESHNTLKDHKPGLSHKKTCQPINS